MIWLQSAALALVVLMVPNVRPQRLDHDEQCPNCGQWMPHSRLVLRHPRECTGEPSLDDHDQVELGSPQGLDADVIMEDAPLQHAVASPIHQPSITYAPAPAAAAQAASAGAALLSTTALTSDQCLSLEVDTFLLQAIPGAKQQQQFLNIFRDNPDGRYRPTALTVAQVRANVTQGRLGPGFTTYDIRDLAKLDHAQHPQEYFVTVRNDMRQVIKDLVQKCFMQGGAQTWAKYAAEVVDSKGVRRIDEPWTADEWLDAQAKLYDRPIIWLVLWSDGTTYDKAMHQKEHMVTLSVANTCIEYQSKASWTDGGQRLLALLPKVRKWADETDLDFQQRQGLVLQWAMQKVLGQLKEICTPGSFLQVTWPDGSQDDCHVRPLAYVADLQEQWALLSLKGTGTNLPDVQHMMPKEQLADFSTPLDSYSVRTEQLHKQAVEQYKSQDPVVHAAGQALLDQLSMKYVPFVALWGFFANVYSAFPPDILHQDYLGITQHILNYISKVLNSRDRKRVNERLAQMLPLHQADYPSQGMDASKMRGDEAKSLMKFLAPALYGILPDADVKVIADYACVARLRDARTHTTVPRSAGKGLGGSLLQLANNIDRVGSKLSSMLTRADKSPTFPKMHNMRKYPGAILRLGNVQHANTAGREGAIRPLRECWERTDKHPRTLSRHVAQKVQLFEDLSAASRRQAAANPPHRRGGTGVRQRAMATGAPAVAVTSLQFNCSQLQVSGSTESKLAAEIPQLQHLPAALQEAFHASPETAAVEIRASIGLPRTGGADLLHSHPAFFGRQQHNLVLDDVAYQGAVRSRLGGDVLGVYYAQVVAVGTFNSQPFVFGRDYASSGQVSSVLQLQPLGWEARSRARSNTLAAAGAFRALDVATLLHRACIVPDFKQGEGHFFVNHWVHEAEEHLTQEQHIDTIVE